MLNTKSESHWPFGPGEEDIKRGLTIYWRGGHLGHVIEQFESIWANLS